MHTRIIPEETESVETENQSGFQTVAFDMQGLLVKMEQMVQDLLDQGEFLNGKFKNFHKIAQNYATRIYV